MDLGIKNKFCLVTGGGKNIGKAIATELVKEGVRVLIIGRDKKSLMNTTDYLNSLSNLNHLYFKCDVTKDVHITNSISENKKGHNWNGLNLSVRYYFGKRSTKKPFWRIKIRKED